MSARWGTSGFPDFNTSCLLVLSAENFYKLYLPDTLIIFLKDFFDKINVKKKNQETKNYFASKDMDAGSSLTGGTALCPRARRYISAYSCFNTKRPITT